MAIDFTVIVPFRNASRTLETCLRSLAEQDYPAESYEILAVDNSSRDNSRIIANQHSPRVRILVEQRPGAYAARNLAAGQARGRWLAFTDADCVVKADWLSRWAAAFRDQPEMHLLMGPRLAPADSRALAKLLATLENAKAEVILTARLERRYYGLWLFDRQAGQARPVPQGIRWHRFSPHSSPETPWLSWEISESRRRMRL